MQYFSSTDAYGLGLIAKNPRRDWSRIKRHLSPYAREIADELTSPGKASRDVKKAARELLELAEKISE